MIRNYRKRYVPTIGHMMKEDMKNLDVTPYKVAKECGINYNTMNKILNDKTSLSSENAIKIARYLYRGEDDYVYVRLRDHLAMEKVKNDKELQEELKKINILELYERQ